MSSIHQLESGFAIVTPFFADILNVHQEQKAFFDRVFTKEGGIFKGFIFD